MIPKTLASGDACCSFQFRPSLLRKIAEILPTKLLPVVLDAAKGQCHQTDMVDIKITVRSLGSFCRPPTQIWFL